MQRLGIVLRSGVILCIALGGCRDGPTDRQRVTQFNLKWLHAAVNQFRIDTGRYPSEEEGLRALVERPDNTEGWPQGGYLETPEIPLDGWGRAFIYECPGKHGSPFRIRSLGADGKEGGAGSDADLSS